MDDVRRATPAPRRLGRAVALLAVVVVAAAALIAWAALGGLSEDAAAPAGGSGAASAAAPSRPDAFDERRAWRLLRRQVALGPRPAGSSAARRLARDARRRLPRGRFERVRGGLLNVVGTVPGRRPAVVVGAHYDTKDLDGFVGANDGASGTAVVLELARVLARAKRPDGAPELRFVLFDGEESPDESRPFYSSGLRGSRAYAARHRDEVGAVVVLDMVGDVELSIPREESSDPALWQRLREAAGAAGTLEVFPDATRSTILDDHTPFLRAGIPAIDVIDFEFACWHELCDDLDVVSPRSLDAVGETATHLLRRWR
jgi:hypothetical protein